MAIMNEETFGPVLPIMRVRDEDEALRLANDSEYGLNANVWTRNKHKGAELGRALPGRPGAGRGPRQRCASRRGALRRPPRRVMFASCRKIRC